MNPGLWSEGGHRDAVIPFCPIPPSLDGSARARTDPCFEKHFLVCFLLLPDCAPFNKIHKLHLSCPFLLSGGRLAPYGLSLHPLFLSRKHFLSSFSAKARAKQFERREECYHRKREEGRGIDFSTFFLSGEKSCQNEVKQKGAIWRETLPPGGRINKLSGQ